jgi:hypothetical protein
MSLAGILVEAVIVGALAAFTLIYAFQTKVEYPAWVMQSWEHPWALVLVAVAALLLLPSSPVIAAMLLLFVAALAMDALVFARKPIYTTDTAALMDLTPEPGQFPNAAQADSGNLATSDALAPAWESGPALDNVPLVEPSYPTFFGAQLHPIGPAPFF